LKKGKKIKKPPLFPHGGGDCPFYADGKCGRETNDRLPGLCSQPPGPGKRCILDDNGREGIRIEGVVI
jgi:hypothetical protein